MKIYADMKSRSFGMFYTASHGSFCVKQSQMVCPLKRQPNEIDPQLAVRLEYSSTDRLPFGQKSVC